MQGYPTPGYLSIVNNLPNYFSGRCDIGSSISNSSFELKNTSKEELISFFCPSSNWTRKFFFPTTLWKNPTTYFLFILLLISLVIFSNSPTLAFTTYPTPIFVLVYLVIFIPSLALAKGELMVYLGGRGGRILIVSNIECMIDFCFSVKGHPNKKTQTSEKSPGR